MKISARNVFEGTVSQLTPGAVNAEVELSLPGGDRIVAIVTQDSVKSLGLAIGKPATAVVKAPWVMILTDSGLRFSARNQLAGTVSRITRGTINSEVSVRLPGGNEVHAIITNDAVSELGLAPGAPATAVIKASHVVLAVPA